MRVGAGGAPGPWTDWSAARNHRMSPVSRPASGVTEFDLARFRSRVVLSAESLPSANRTAIASRRPENGAGMPVCRSPGRCASPSRWSDGYTAGRLSSRDRRIVDEVVEVRSDGPHSLGRIPRERGGERLAAAVSALQLSGGHTGRSPRPQGDLQRLPVATSIAGVTSVIGGRDHRPSGCRGCPRRPQSLRRSRRRPARRTRRRPRRPRGGT
jgi:hypothetical protein